MLSIKVVLESILIAWFFIILLFNLVTKEEL